MIRFLLWHYSTGLTTLLTIFKNLFYFLYNFFSIPNLSLTIFSPWKRGVFKYVGPGLHLDRFFETLTLNLISTTIGTIVRVITIYIWVLVTLTACLIFFFILSVYIFIPFFSLPFYIEWKNNEQKKPKNLLLKYGPDSKNLSKQFFSKDFSEFIFKSLEIPQSEYQSLYNSQNTPEEEKLLQEDLLKAEPNIYNFAKAFAKTYSPLTELLDQHNISSDDFLKVVSWWDRQKVDERFKKRFWELENLQKIKSLGKDWAYGYTPNLDKFSEDLNLITQSSPRLIGRKKEVETIERILSKRGENNILLIGEPGVGRKTILFGLAQKISQGQTTPALSHKRVLFFDINSALADEITIEGKRTKLLDILKEAESAGNLILAINSFEKFISQSEENTDFTDVFAQEIGSSDLQVVGISTPTEYHRRILPNATVLRLFETVEVFPPNKEEAIAILQDLVPQFEKRQKVFISYFALKEIVDRSDTLVTDVPFPEKAINLLDESVFFATNNLKTNLINKEVIDKIISEKTKIPLTELTKGEKEKLLNIEDFLHQQIVDQEEAITAIGKAMKRGRLRIGSTNKPLGSLLFLGPTGVGKTETAKALAKLYFGSEDKLIRLDMAEFIGPSAVEKLIGSPEEKPGILTTLVKDSPYSVLLLDEFEKTTPEIINLFLTIFDEGYVKDGSGKTVYFTHLIIIATSNAASELIREKVAESEDIEQLSKDLENYILKEGIFSPELLNRFDDIVIFKPLTLPHLHQIAKMMLDKLNERLDKEQQVTIKITEDLITKVATQGFDPTFGARPMNRLIQDKIEAPVAQMILEGKAKKGDIIDITL